MTPELSSTDLDAYNRLLEAEGEKPIVKSPKQGGGSSQSVPRKEKRATVLAATVARVAGCNCGLGGGTLTPRGHLEGRGSSGAGKIPRSVRKERS